MTYTLPGQNLEGFIIGDHPIYNNAAMAMIRVFTKTHIGDDNHLGQLGLNGSYSPLDYTVFCVTSAAHTVLSVRQTKKDDPRYAQLPEGTRLFHNGVYAEVEVTREG
jgi:hypothetical protein